MNLPFLWWLPLGKTAEISAEELHKRLEKGWDVQLVDARTGLEYRQGTIGPAWHASVTEVPASIRNLELDKNRPVVVLCASGHRSLPGTRWLRANGYEAYSLRGGVLGWKQAGYKVRPPKSDRRK